MKKLSQILIQPITTIDSPNKVVVFLQNHYGIKHTYFHFMEESLTFVFVVNLTFWGMVRYQISRTYKQRVWNTLEESTAGIESPIKVIKIIEL